VQNQQGAKSPLKVELFIFDLPMNLYIIRFCIVSELVFKKGLYLISAKSARGEKSIKSGTLHF